MIIKLVPRKYEKYYEHVELQIDSDYPMALVRLDLLWDANDHAIYDKLYIGETVLVNLVDISEIDE